jgi:hypothetical protein
MMVGALNMNFAIPVAKMQITNTGTGEKITVLYNPESYTQQRNVVYTAVGGIGQNGEIKQFARGGAEHLSFELFFDSFSAGPEAGSLMDKAVLTASSLAVSAAKADVRAFTKKVYSLMDINGSTHAPPVLKIEWSSLQFTGVLINCTQKFTKFNEFGKPVRAILNVEFEEYLKPAELAKAEPRESPDTSKFRTVSQGDSLWSLADAAYGDASQWRRIAQANNIDNPRILKNGGLLRLPAI